MDTSGGKLATLVLMIAVLGYTAYNYIHGKRNFWFFASWVSCF
jgi:hypothetical protein